MCKNTSYRKDQKELIVSTYVHSTSDIKEHRSNLRAVPRPGGHGARIAEQTGHFAQFPSDLQGACAHDCPVFELRYIHTWFTLSF